VSFSLIIRVQSSVMSQFGSAVKFTQVQYFPFSDTAKTFDPTRCSIRTTGFPSIVFKRRFFAFEESGMSLGIFQVLISLKSFPKELNFECSS